MWRVSNPFNRSMICTVCLTGAACILVCLLVSCGEKPTPKTEYSAFVDKAVEVWDFQGAYLVAKGDSVLAQGARGFACRDETRRNSVDTKFLIGSMTKSFTAVAILQLVDQGLVTPDAPISTYLPDYPKEVADHVTVHDLLSHQSGIPDLVRNPDFISNMSQPITPDEMVAMIQTMPLVFAPETDYQYSSSNYVLLAQIVESVSGVSWTEYVETNICDRLGMGNTGVYGAYYERDDFACGYVTDGAGNMVRAPRIDISRGYGAGALGSAVGDLHTFSQALYDTDFLSQEATELMNTAHTTRYGYGWMIDTFGGHHLAAHGGGLPGFVSIMQRWLDDSVCAVVLSNSVFPPVHNIANGLSAIAMGEPYDLPVVKQPVEVSSDDLSICVGSYQFETGGTIQIASDGDHLLLLRSGMPPYVLLPETPDRFFFAHDHMTTITFLRDSANHVYAQVWAQAFDRDTAWTTQ